MSCNHEAARPAGAVITGVPWLNPKTRRKGSPGLAQMMWCPACGALQIPDDGEGKWSEPSSPRDSLEGVRVALQALTIGLALDRVAHVSVLLLGVERDDRTPATATFTAALRPGDKKIWRLQVYRPIQGGAYLVGLNGALIEQVQIGDCMQQLSFPGAGDSGPVVRLTDAIVPGIEMRCTVSLAGGVA
jgi:hypothetical protein